MAAGGVVVEQASIGPYDYAVLKADDETAMLQWLSDNRYFVPAGTMDAVKPYIHPGAYFLALKLRGGESTGDITPIVLRYTSDLPMIPITLTQVGAVDNMGVLVWVARRGARHPAQLLPRRPRRPAGLVLQLRQLQRRAHRRRARGAGQARLHHAVRRLAAASPTNRLVYPGRFGDLDTLRAQTTPSAYLHYLFSQRLHASSGVLLSILARYIPEPQALVDQGVPLVAVLSALRQLRARSADGDVDGGIDPTAPFDPGRAHRRDRQRIVQPTKDANALFSAHPYLTRLYTALSPKDMTIDPVFSFNRDLPTCRSLHSATLTTPCKGQPWLSTDVGFEAQYLNGLPPTNLNLPAALRVELLRDAGQPELVQDNTDQHPRHARAGRPRPRDGAARRDRRLRLHRRQRRVRTNVAMLFAAAAMLLAARTLRRRRARA